MKKTVIISIVLFIFSLSLLADNEKEIKAEIKHVTVYPDRAQLNHESVFDLAQGKTILKLKGLSPYIEAQSIQVKGTGEFTILSVNLQNNFLQNLEESPEVKSIKSQIESLDGIILEDYNKGVLTKDLIKAIIQMAKDHKKTITVDPKSNNFFEYRGVSVFKPNRKEAEEALGQRLHALPDIEAAARALLTRLDSESILLTLGEQGMLLLEKNGSFAHVETKARHVADVSGAGDTVIATLTMAIVAGGSVRESAALANYAGGIVCGEIGIVPIDKNLLVQTILKDINNGGKQ